MDIKEVVTKPPFLMANSVEEKRLEIKEYFNKTFDLYEDLFRVIIDEKSYYSRPEPLRHPLVFYYGHTATFFINKLIAAKVINERINFDFESKFAIGVDEMSWDDLDEKNYNWPSLAEVYKYRDNTRELVNNVIDSMDINIPIAQSDAAWVILMGIEHERIHIETSSVIIRQLPIDEVCPTGVWVKIELDILDTPNNTLLNVEGGSVVLGKDDNTFGWDNEYGNFAGEVKPFKASQYLVSNKEFNDFVVDRGYEIIENWDDEGKRWLKSMKPEMPKFWVHGKSGMKLRIMAEEIDLPWSWPVEINYYEAKAFCNWKSKKEGLNFRLPTESEWYKLREEISEDLTDWDEAPGNINLEHFVSPCSINRYKQGRFYDVIGNVWQWSETPIDGFEGFKVHPVYDDFSVPTFDGKHNLIKGGSWISTGNEALKSARYAFRKHFYQHAGFRYVEAEPLSKLQITENNTYESSELVNQYVEFHYGEEFFSVKNFPKACIDGVKEYFSKNKNGKALDLGCAVGRSTFELAPYFKNVVGIDFTARFIEKADEIKRTGYLNYHSKTEGDLFEQKKAMLSDFSTAELSNKVEFWQGDACNLKPHFKNFDFIFCGNLIDRLYDPEKFLKTIHQRMNAEGILVLTSPYTWLEEYTKKENWIGGFKAENGENVDTLSGLKAVLSEKFDFLCHKDVPFVIKETNRKFQHTIADMSVWKMK